MKKPFLYTSVVSMSIGCSDPGASDTIEYQGERFRLSRSFRTYEEYKDAEEKLARTEIDRLAKRMTSVQLAPVYGTREDFIRAAMEVRFPGFGWSGLQGATNLCAAGIEIPYKDLDRYFTVIQREGGWHIVDDFVAPIAQAASSVHIEGSTLIYRDAKATEIRRKPLSK